jgi:hypothetical protein
MTEQFEYSCEIKARVWEIVAHCGECPYDGPECEATETCSTCQEAAYLEMARWEIEGGSK